MAFGWIFVAGRLDRARAHPAPDQHDVLVRCVVEAVPDAARRIDHVAFDRRLQALVGDDVALALEHDEELVAVPVQMPLVAGAGLEHGPADDVVGAGRFLVDQELHLHVDPAVVALQAFDLRHVLDVGAEHLGAERRRGDPRRRLHGLGQRRADLFTLARHDCPPKAGDTLHAPPRNRCRRCRARGRRSSSRWRRRRAAPGCRAGARD